MTKLTSINLSTGVTPNDFIHIVNTGDTSQSIDGSSYKATLGQLSSLYTFTGGTVAGVTNFSSGVNTNTISATTYINLPTDIYVTGGTYSTGTTTFKNNTGGTFNISGYTTPFTGGSSNCITDLYVTNIHGCSPITIHDNIKSNGSTVSGTTSFAFGNSVGSYANYSAILGGTNHNISSGGTSAGMFGGSSNTITGNSQNSVILGGSSNVINNHESAAILAGYNNTIHFDVEYNGTETKQYEVIIGGNNNTISASTNSLILGGNNNNLSNFTSSVIIGGSQNTFLDTTNDYSYYSSGIFTSFKRSLNSSIVGGSGNIIYNKTVNSGIFGGTSNIISGQTVSEDYSIYDNSIIGGSGNTINGNTSSSVIAGGTSNTISGHTNAFIGGGSNNLIDYGCAPASSGNTNESIIGGDNNKIYSSYNSSIVGGSGNTVTNLTYGGGFNNLFGGTNNILRNGVSSSIIGGQSNLIGVSNCTAIGSTIIGGSGNTLNGSLGNNNYSSIIGGFGNDSNSNYTSIIGNYKSNIGNSSDYSSLIGGYTNGITASTSSIIGGGELNRIDGGDYIAIIGGYNNNVKNGSNKSVIIGGEENVIVNGVNNSVILGGAGITATTNSYVYVPSLNIRTVDTGAYAYDINIDANGNLTTSSSDERLKENITPIVGALDTVKLLNGVNYQWKDRSAGGDEIKLGFIAQQVELVEPKLVFTNKVDGYKGLHTDGIIPLLVESVKEMSKTIEDLKEEIRILKNK
jgi:hypothetical protein